MPKKTSNTSMLAGNKTITIPAKTEIFRSSCHKGPIEIHPGFWIGDQDEGEAALKKGLAKIAVPLNKMDGDIWEKWDGEIIYIPIKDFSVLPRAIAERKVKELVEKIKTSSISMFCLGGHGRTGYMAALILGFLGYEDPIAFLRKNYCEKAIESFVQIKQISEILQKPELLTTHAPSKFYLYGNEGQCLSCLLVDSCKRVKQGDCPYYISYEEGGDF